MSESPVEAIKHAVDTLSDDGKPNQEFIEELERIFDQYPERIDELLAIAREEITNATLPKLVRTEIHNLLKQAKVPRVKNSKKQEIVLLNSDSKYESWNEFLKSEDNTSVQLSPGMIIRNTYQLETRLGVGGMGELWKASHLIQTVAETSSRDRFVAIKFLNIDFRNHPDALKMLAREFAYSRKLIHENIVQVFELNYTGNRAYIAMEYLFGYPLNQWIKDHPKGISLEEAAPIISGICDALKFAHLHEFVHLDVKPGNVIYDPETGMVKVIDFGIARHVNPIDRDKTSFDLGKLNAVTGTYASLEMQRGVNPDPSDDIYGLACMTYELLTGRHPYDRLPADTAISNNLKPAEVPGLKPEQNNTLLKGLDLYRKQRIFDAEQFRNGLLSIPNEPKYFDGFSVRAVLSALLVVGAILLVPKFVGNLLDMQLDAVRQGILAGNPASAVEAFRSPKDDQVEIFANKDVINALLNIYTKNREDDPINEFKTLAQPLRKQIYEDTDFKNKLMLHYQRSIDENVILDAYPKAEELLASINGVYPDSNQIAEKSRTIQIAKSQRLTLLVGQFKSCFPDHLKSPKKLSDCLVSNRSKLLTIEPEKQFSLRKINAWFRESIHESLNQKEVKLGAYLLNNWETIQQKDSPSRSVLRDSITISNARISSFPQLWTKFANSDASQRSKILNIKLSQEKLLDYISDNASLSAKQNDYPNAFNILNEAIEVVKSHPNSLSRLRTTKTALKQEYDKKIGVLI